MYWRTIAADGHKRYRLVSEHAHSYTAVPTLTLTVAHLSQPRSVISPSADNVTSVMDELTLWYIFTPLIPFLHVHLPQLLRRAKTIFCCVFHNACPWFVLHVGGHGRRSFSAGDSRFSRRWLPYISEKRIATIFRAKSCQFQPPTRPHQKGKRVLHNHEVLSHIQILLEKFLKLQK
jgi:hypothetical protein